MNLDTYINEFRSLFKTTKPRNVITQINESESVSTTFVKTKTPKSVIESRLRLEGFNKIKDNIWRNQHENLDVLIACEMVQFFESRKSTNDDDKIIK